MKRTLTMLAAILPVLLVVLVVSTSPVFAEEVLQPACDVNPNHALCQTGPQANPLFGPTGIINKVGTLLAIAVGVASVIMIIIGGIKFIMSSGDPANIKKAKDTIIYAVIGLIVAAFAQLLVVFVVNKIAI